MAEDLLIGYFFQGKDPNVIADQQLLFLMYAMGILPSYSGKSPTSAHLELPTIHTGHFDRRLVLLRETLQSHQVQARDIETWIDFEEAFRGVVVSI